MTEDLSELKRLAEAARDIKTKIGHRLEGHLTPQGQTDVDLMRAYLDAASPSAILSLIARVERLEEALKPFANMLPAFVDFLPPDAEDCEYEINGAIFRLKDIRAAARTIMGKP